MRNDFQFNDFKYAQLYVQQNIYDFILPKKPEASNNDSYFTDLSLYAEQMQAYFVLYSDYLIDIYKNTGYLEDKYKEAYSKLYGDLKSYQSYIEKVKENYASSNQIELNESPENGSMSPSNPCFTMFDDNVTVQTPSCRLKNDMNILDLLDDDILNKFKKKLKDVRRYIQKEKLQVPKKLTKKQKKKLKKKIKSQKEEKEISIYETMKNDNYYGDDPQFMIQEFFSEYALTGEWSWTQFNNCISKIHQELPQWFDVFSQYCCSMGINWNEMFMSDVQSIEMTNVRIDIASLEDSKKNNSVKNSNGISNEGISVIFTDDVIVRDVTELSSNELYCDTCCHEFKSKRAFHIHLRGVKHTQNEIKHVSMQKPEKFLEEINKENASILNDTNKEDKHLKWLLNNDDISKETGTYTCKICDVTCTSQKDFKSHLNGDKHKSNAAPNATLADNNTGNSEMNKVVETKTISKSNKKPIARIQILLNQCTQALIGLQYINEYQKLDILLESWYYCELCNFKLDRKFLIPHIISFKHRETYLKQNYYDLYELIEQDPSSKSVRTKRLEVFSEQIEIFEGRKSVNILIEKKSGNLSEVPSVNFEPPSVPEIQLTSQLPENRKRKSDIEDLSLKLPKSNKSCEENDENDEDDKEDGEIETSDDECQPDPLSVNIGSTSTSIKESKPDSDTELEAGEIENEASENDDDSDESLELAGLTCSDDLDKTVINKSEFANYEPLYTNERPPLNSRDISRESCRIEFLRHNRDRKKIKLKEVTQAILSHFKQEAIWALRRVKQTNSSHSNYGNLLLPPSKQPVGPIYPGISDSTTRSAYLQSNAQILSPEIEFTNIINKIESMTGKELTANRFKGKCNFNDTNLLCDVQNMLVNKTTNDKLNEMVRKELLLDTSFGKETESIIKPNREPILKEPIDVKVLNETVELLKKYPDIFKSSNSNNLSEVNPDNQHSSFDQAPLKSTNLSNLECMKIGEKLSRQAEFLGVDQPPPPNFQKLNANIYPEPHNFNILPSSLQPFLTPGMIEHPSAFSNYNNNFVYPYPFLSHNSGSATRVSSEILNSHNRTNI